MQLSRKADYALRAVTHFAGLPKGQLSSIGTVAEAQQIPREFLAKILKDLTWAGILVSYQGVTGGYRLARAPKDISFLNVIEAMEGPISLNLCTQESRCECERMGSCRMHDFWVKQEAYFKKALSRANFAKYRTPIKEK